MNKRKLAYGLAIGGLVCLLAPLGAAVGMSLLGMVFKAGWLAVAGFTFFVFYVAEAFAFLIRMEKLLLQEGKERFKRETRELRESGTLGDFGVGSYWIFRENGRAVKDLLFLLGR